jgi:hypothetical protein
MTDEHAADTEAPADTEGTEDREPAPGLPEIRDEAADTPSWVPLLGLSLLVVSVLGVVLSATLTSEGADDVADEAGVVVDADDEGDDE